jgi:pimeloyl-ACP methyl ester carboxylesterase
MATHSTMESMTANGVRLEYEVRGTGDPLVLSHVGLVADAFAPLMNQQALRSYRLIRYHRRGHGGSTHTAGPVSIADQAADLAGLLDHLGIGRAHVAGHSISGLIALQLAADRPDLVGTLVLMEPPLRRHTNGPGVQAMSERIAVGYQRYGQGNREGAIDSFLSPLFGPDYREILERALPDSWTQMVRDADMFFTLEAAAMAQWPFGAAEAARITIPVLSLVGTESHAGAIEFEQVLRAWFPQLETARVPGVNHMMHLRHPEPVAEKMAEFLARHPLR